MYGQQYTRVIRRPSLIVSSCLSLGTLTDDRLETSTSRVVNTMTFQSPTEYMLLSYANEDSILSAHGTLTACHFERPVGIGH